MAKKTPKATARKNAPAKTPARRAPHAKVPSAGTPVTLEEAQALALATAPRLAARRAATPQAPAQDGPSPATVGKEREKLRKRQEDDREANRREYTAVMRIMKERGARAPAGKGARRGTVAATRFTPLQVVAEGDSWFKYPVPLFGGGIIRRLQKRLGVPILNLAAAGDEVRFMLGVEQRKRLSETLTEGCPAGGPWDVLLFSGGGNDIVDNPMALWIREWNSAVPPKRHLDDVRFAAALTLVRAGYEDLIAMRDKHSPNTRLVFHGYDYAIPDGRGVCKYGPWLKPTFDLHGFPNQATAQEVVNEMLTRFAFMLQQLSSDSVTYVSTQGTLHAQPSAWHNELHPEKKGFDTFADMFHAHLRQIFPGRVL